MRTSAEQVPSLHRVAPRYLILVTSSSFWPFVLVRAVSHNILLFFVLTSIPLIRLRVGEVLNLSSPLLTLLRWISEANRGLHMDLPPMEMDVWWSWNFPA